MLAILRGANGRRHEVDFHDDPVAVAVAMSATTVQITMTTTDCSNLSRGRYVTVSSRPATKAVWDVSDPGCVKTPPLL